MLRDDKNIGTYGKYGDSIKLTNGFIVPANANLFVVDFTNKKFYYIDEIDMRELSASLTKIDLNNNAIYELESFSLLTDYVGDVLSFKKKYIVNYLIYLTLNKREKINELASEISLTKEEITEIINSDVEGIKFPHYIADYMIPEAIKTILDYGYDINTRTIETGTTLLLNVIGKGDVKSAEIILDNKPDVNIQDNTGMTALMLSMSTRYLKSHEMNLAIITKLLDNVDIDVNIKDFNGFTALTHLLESLSDIVITPEINEIITKLLSKPTLDVNTKIRSGLTQLMFAILLCSESDNESRHVMVDELLKRSDIDMCAQDITGKTALMHAISGGKNCRKHIIEKLLPNDFSNEKIYDCMHLVDNEKRNWLIYAILYRYFDIINDHIALIDINDVDIYGKTALMYAISRKYNDIAELLIENGANLDVVDIKGLTALDYAKKYNNKKIIEKITLKQSGGERLTKKLYSLTSDVLNYIN